MLASFPPHLHSHHIRSPLLSHPLRDGLSLRRQRTISTWARQPRRSGTNHTQWRGGTAGWGKRAACQRESPRRSPPPRRAASRQLCPPQERSLATPALEQPWGGRRGTRPAPAEKGAHRKKHQIHTYRRTTAWEEGEGRRGGQRNSHANLAAGSSSRKRSPGAPGELCPSGTEGMRMRHRLDRNGGGCSIADSARSDRPR